MFDGSLAFFDGPHLVSVQGKLPWFWHNTVSLIIGIPCPSSINVRDIASSDEDIFRYKLGNKRWFVLIYLMVWKNLSFLASPNRKKSNYQYIVGCVSHRRRKIVLIELDSPKTLRIILENWCAVSASNKRKNCRVAVLCCHFFVLNCVMHVGDGIFLKSTSFDNFIPMIIHDIAKLLFDWNVYEIFRVWCTNQLLTVWALSFSSAGRCVFLTCCTSNVKLRFVIWIHQFHDLIIGVGYLNWAVFHHVHNLE